MDKTEFLTQLKEKFQIPNQFFEQYKQYIGKTHMTGIMFFTPTKIQKTLDFYKRNDITPTFIDLGCIYAGMGNLIVLTYDMSICKFYFKYEGGSDDFDRAIRLKYYTGLTYTMYEKLSDGTYHPLVPPIVTKMKPEFDATKLDPIYLIDPSDVWRIIENREGIHIIDPSK